MVVFIFSMCQYKYEEQGYQIDVFFFTCGWPIALQGALRARPIRAQPMKAQPNRALGGP